MRILICLAVLLTAALIVPKSRIEAAQELIAVKEAEEQPRLSVEDKNQLAELLRLKETSGSLVWPGLAEAVIPLIQYNERYEFLIFHSEPPFPWEVVEDDVFHKSSYYLRPSGETVAFAVPVGDLWAGSLNTLSSMRRSMEEMLKEQVPPDKLTPAFIKMMTVSPGQHVVFLLHEAFHAFQAMEAHDRFRKANSVYVSEKDYPFADEDFQSAWKKEGELLASALRAKDESERQESISEFLEIRKERRLNASLSPELIAFEQELEWLEGLAKYVEMRFAELGSTGIDEERSKAYRIVRNRLRADFNSRLMRLNEQHGDLRFYLSGAALAMLLDEMSPGWKRDFLNQKNIALEELF
jgi:curved DNA-binding protein CbpA